jgi:hypothetical protein
MEVNNFRLVFQTTCSADFSFAIMIGVLLQTGFHLFKAS